MPDLVSAFAAASTAANAILGDSQAPYALFAQQGRMIGTIAVDVPLREVHSDTFAISQHPVASGTPVADHVFANPAQLEVSVGYSASTAGYVSYPQDVYESFRALAKTAKPFSVITGKRVYDNLMFAEIDVLTDAASEYVLQLTARLQEVIITSTDTGSTGLVAANQALPAETSPTTDMGTVTPLPYFASGTIPSGYTPPPPAGIGSTVAVPFFTSGAPGAKP